MRPSLTAADLTYRSGFDWCNHNTEANVAPAYHLIFLQLNDSKPISFEEGGTELNSNGNPKLR